MKRITGLAIALFAVVGSCYVGNASAMTCNLDHNGQTVTIDTNPGVVDAQEGWNSYSGVTPRCPAYVVNAYVAAAQGANRPSEEVSEGQVQATPVRTLATMVVDKYGAKVAAMKTPEEKAQWIESFTKELALTSGMTRRQRDGLYEALFDYFDLPRYLHAMPTASKSATENCEKKSATRGELESCLKANG